MMEESSFKSMIKKEEKGRPSKCTRIGPTTAESCCVVYKRGDSGTPVSAAGVTSIPRPVPSVFLRFTNGVGTPQGGRCFLTQAVGTSVPGDCVPHRPYAEGKARLWKTFPTSTSDLLAPVNPSHSSFPLLAWLHYSNP